MKRIRIHLINLVVAGLAASASAEVAVKTIGQHQYKCFRSDTFYEAGSAFRWKRVTGPVEDDYLNPNGDLNGDMPPKSVVIPPNIFVTETSPLVVWSRPLNGTLILHWSAWTSRGGWSSPRTVSTESALDEVDARLYLDAAGDVHATWSAISGGTGAVYYARYTKGAWTRTLRLGTPLHDVRNPRFEITRDNHLIVTWEDWTGRPVKVESFLSEEFDP